MKQNSSPLRILIDSVPHVETVAMGVWFGVGTRDEDVPTQNGIAHLVEHMLFKGTASRSAQDLVREVESAGAQINAYTGRELTAYTVYALKNDLNKGMEILSDMILHSTYDKRELALEQDVIVQEIGMVADTPDDIIHDDTFLTAFPDQAFGRPVLGSESVIRALKRDDLLDYTRTHYHPGSAVVSIAGNVNEADAREMVQRLFKNWKGGAERTRAPAKYAGGRHYADRKLEQTHIVYGLESFPRADKRFTALSLYSEALGGGMASRLFQEVREKRGLAYSVYAANQVFADTGFLNIYAGTDPAKAQDCLDVIRGELQACMTHITEDDLQRAKTQRKAGLLMSQESMMARADRAARQILLSGKATPVAETIAKIDAVTYQDLKDLCNDLSERPITLAVRGPNADKIRAL